METQGIWVQTGQFIVSGTVLNILFSADKNKTKSLIFAVVLKAKQEQVHFHLVCGQTGNIPWNAHCCVFGIWLLFPEASKGAGTDNAEAYVDGKEHASASLKSSTPLFTAWLLWLSSETSKRSWLYPMSSGYRKPLLKDEGSQVAADVGLCSAPRSTRSTHCLNQPVLSWSFLCSI